MSKRTRRCVRRRGPAGADGDLVRFVYLDASGNAVASRVVTVAIESE